MVNQSYEVTGEFYVVKPADNLWNLGRAFGTTAEKIRNLNKLPRNATLYVGQKLKIPGKKSRNLPQSPIPPARVPILCIR